MDCPVCESPTVGFDVPDALAEFAPAAAVAVCTECLHVAEREEPPEESPDPARISDALPADETAALGMLLLVDHLDSLASNRAAIESLLALVEERGADPALAFDRLADDPDLRPAVDIRRRSTQLEQLRS